MESGEWVVLVALCIWSCERSDPLVLVLILQENQEGAQGLVISNTELKQVVYAFKCNQSTLQVKGKINSITIGKSSEPGQNL